MQTIVLPDGKYAVERDSGTVRVFWFQTVAASKSARSAWKRWIYYRRGTHWIPFAFLNDDGSVELFGKYRETWTQQQVLAISEDVAEILRDKEKAFRLYPIANKILKESRA